MTALPDAAAPAIAMRSVSFGYAGHPVVSDLTLRIERAEVVALLGPNGSGKSTLVRGLLGLNDHLAGEVEILGGALTGRADRARLGYVPQRHTLSGSIRSTVREVVATGRLAHRPWWRRAGKEDAALVDRALHTVGLADRARADVATLSGGQQRRVLIARALVGEPSVLIMDEPTAGVDTASQDILAQVLRRLAQSGVTLLVVTHELAALQGIVHRIVEMDAGHVVFDGTPQGYAGRVAEQVGAPDHAHHQAGRRQPRHDGHHHDDHHHDDRHTSPRLVSGPYDRRRRELG